MIASQLLSASSMRFVVVGTLIALIITLHPYPLRTSNLTQSFPLLQFPVLQRAKPQFLLLVFPRQLSRTLPRRLLQQIKVQEVQLSHLFILSQGFAKMLIYHLTSETSRERRTLAKDHHIIPTPPFRASKSRKTSSI